MKIIIADQTWSEKWDDFVKQNAADFGWLQSWSWGDFQISLKRKIWRLAVVDQNNKIQLVALIIKQPLKFGWSYFYCPRGPVTIQNNYQKISVLFNLLLEKIESIGRAERAIFFRLEPAWPADDDRLRFLRQMNFSASGQVQPKQTLILDLKKNPEETLAAMKPKTRYNLKLAEKHGLTIDRGEKYFNDFWRLMTQTAKRDRFHSHPQKYYQKMVANFSAQGDLWLLVAKDQTRVVAANLVVFWGKWAVYLHGASDYDYRDKMPPYLLQWAAISEARKRGAMFYDFWGVDRKKWPGVTRFKQGFCPRQSFTRYVGSFDRPLKILWYNVYKMMKKINL